MLPKTLINKVDEVVFHSDPRNISYEVNNTINKQFKLFASNVNLIPNGLLFSDVDYSMILIINCNIISIAPRAFHHLKAEIFNILDTNITQVNSQAFHNVKVDRVSIQNSRLGLVKSDAIHLKPNSTSSIIKLQNSSLDYVESNALCNIGMENITINYYEELALSVCEDIATNHHYEEVFLSRECRCNMYKIISLEHKHDSTNNEGISLAKDQAERKILNNLNCLWRGYHYSWSDFDDYYCKEEHTQSTFGLLFR